MVTALSTRLWTHFLCIGSKIHKVYTRAVTQLK